MKAMVLYEQKPIEENPLVFQDYPEPNIDKDEIRVKIKICGVCRTDLHIVEGELLPHKLPLIVGHQIVGYVDKKGKNVKKFNIGDRVGIPWLNKTCGVCEYCKNGRENLCDNPKFTGYDVDGGFAEYTVIKEDFAYNLPENYDDIEVAPLLCAGVIGYQTFKRSGLKSGKIGLFGFGSAAHILIQVLVHLNFDVFVVSRTEHELALANKLGAVWTGKVDKLNEKLDGILVFAPSGELLVKALDKIKKGGIVVSGGIYTTPLPGFEYKYIFPEKILTSTAHTTRENVMDFLNVARKVKIKVETNEYQLSYANIALYNIKHSKVKGSSLLII